MTREQKMQSQRPWLPAWPRHRLTAESPEPLLPRLQIRGPRKCLLQRSPGLLIYEKIYMGAFGETLRPKYITELGNTADATCPHNEEKK